jgi:hypothetical protein
MQTVRGRLMRAEYINRADMAMLSLTIEQPGAGRFTSQPVEALMTYGTGSIAHSAARRAAGELVLGGLYRINGRGLSATGSQLWLLGVEEWVLMEPAPDALDATAPTSPVFMRDRLMALANVAGA